MVSLQLPLHPDLAGARWLVWHRRAAVWPWLAKLGAVAQMDDGYEAGDCLVVMRKPRGRGRDHPPPRRARAIQSP